MNFLDLFAGIGGFSLGLERAGMQCVGQVEIEPFCLSVLEHHWPAVWRGKDVRDVAPDDVVRRCGRIDLLCGGFPCQDLSVAGKGKGLSGERSGLWWEMFRLIRGIRPDWLLIENVPALRTRGADDVLGALESEGYTCWPCVVGAWAVGAPHRRDRVWIVANAGSKQGEQRYDADVQRRRSDDSEQAGMGSCVVGHADGDGLCGQLGVSERRRPKRQRATDDPRPCVVGDSLCSRLAGLPSQPSNNGSQLTASQRTSWPALPGPSQFRWEPSRLAEPGLGLDADGLSHRLARQEHKHRLRAVGNAVVPQVVECFGRAILGVHHAIETV